MGEHRWFEDHIEAIGSRNTDDKFAGVIPDFNRRTGAGRVVLQINTDDFSQAAESQGVYPEFTPERARELGLALITAAHVAEEFSRRGGLGDYCDD